RQPGQRRAAQAHRRAAAVETDRHADVSAEIGGDGFEIGTGAGRQPVEDQMRRVLLIRPPARAKRGARDEHSWARAGRRRLALEDDPLYGAEALVELRRPELSARAHR